MKHYTIFLKVLTYLFLHCAQDSSFAFAKKARASYCDSLTAFKYDEAWLTQNVERNGWYLQYGSSVVRQQLASLLRGRELGGDESDYSELCARVTYIVPENSTNSVIAKYTGFKGMVVLKNCTVREGKEYCSSYNIRNPRKTLLTDQVPVYVDERPQHNYKLLVYCSVNGEDGWLLVSKTRHLTKYEENDLNRRVTKLGYDPAERVAFHSDTNCPMCQRKTKSKILDIFFR